MEAVTYILNGVVLLLTCLPLCLSRVSEVQVLLVNNVCQDYDLDIDTVQATADAAVRNLNSNATSSGYSLRLVVKNIPQISRKQKVRALLQGLSEMSNGVAVMAPGCDEEIELIASVCPLFNMTLITYGFSSLSSVHWYPYWYSMLPSERQLAQAFAGLIKHFGWKRIGLLTQDNGKFPLIAEHIFRELEGVDVQQINIYAYADTVHSIDTSLQNGRVFILNANVSTTRGILCKAQRKGLRYPSYVWILHGWHPIELASNGDCSVTEMDMVLEGSIGVSYTPTNESLISKSDPQIAESMVPVYDAIQVIDSAVKWVAREGCDLSNATRKQNNLEAFKAAIVNVNAAGVNGNITFEDGNINVHSITILQHKKGLTVQNVGYVLLKGALQYVSPYNVTLWPNGAPWDGIPRTVENYPLLPLTVLCYLCATAGIIFTLICLLFSIVFRKRKLLQLTSPMLSYIIGIGALLMYSSVYFFFYPEVSKGTLKVFCSVRSWLSAVGFTLTFGTINLKMWRIYYVFRNPALSKQRQKAMSDWKLASLVALIVIVDLVIETAVVSLNSSRYNIVTIEDQEHPNSIDSNGITTQYIVTRCTSKGEEYWLTVLFGYKVILQVTGVILAFKMRTVQIKGLNDTKETSSILYITSILLALVIIVTLTLGDYLNIDGASYGFGTSTATTLVVAFTFIPKMIRLYKDPNGEKLLDGINDDCKNEISLETIPVISVLEKRVKELQQELEKLQVPENVEHLV